MNVNLWKKFSDGWIVNSVDISEFSKMNKDFIEKNIDSIYESFNHNNTINFEDVEDI